MTKCHEVLLHFGPMISSDLSDILVRDHGMLKNTASQMISRDQSILKVKGFFTSSQSFCYLEEQINQSDFYDILLTSLFEHGRKYWYCLNALKMSGGIISQKYLECYTNYPIVPLKSHIPFREVLQKFVEQKILIFNEDRYLLSPKFNKSFTSYGYYTTIELIKDAVLENFHSWTKTIGFISFNTGETFKEYGKFSFGFKGVSYVTGLMDGTKNGFVVADILMGHPIYENDVRFFIEKINTIKQFNKSSRLIPFLLVDDLDQNALKLLKANGIVVGFIKELFGQKYAETLIELVNILNNAGASLKQTPEKYLDLIRHLKKYNEGLANNIKGTLLEFVVGHLHSVKCQNLDLGREIIDINGNKHEMDVLAIYDDKIVVSECKATKALIDRKTIDKWEHNKLSAFYNWVKSVEPYKEKNIVFEYWSTSGYTVEALGSLNHLKNSSKRFKVEFYDGNDIKDKAKAMKNKKLKEVIDNFFLNSKV